MKEDVKLVGDKFLEIKKEFEQNVWDFKFDIAIAILDAVRDAALDMGQDLQNRTENI